MIGEKADKILATYENGDYIHVNNYAESSEYGADFVINSGSRIEPTSNSLLRFSKQRPPGDASETPLE